MKKLCVFTGSRAEYGLLLPLLKRIKEINEFQLQIIVAGMHLSEEFGFTFKEIENDGFYIDEKIEMLISSDTETSIVKSMGVGMISFSDTLKRLNPDWLIVLGDRFELFSLVTSAYVQKIPIAHLHGGEKTEGAIDEGLRHAITKMSYLHFTSSEEHRQRVMQLGESADRVFNVGAIGLDNIQEMKLLTLKELEKSLNFDLKKPFFVVAFHPVTLENNSSEMHFKELLDAIQQFKEYNFIFTLPNADADGRIIGKMIKSFVKDNYSFCRYFYSLGQQRFLSTVKYSKAIIGNSSSGIIEAPTLNTYTINIGDRQKGRAKAESILNCEPESASIIRLINFVINTPYKPCINPYGSGGTAEKIIKILKNFQDISNLKKTFNDIYVK
jgi:UDP-hydrolysing UDP-N-acetyl-D-glucosamine 2-epimerase